MNSKGAIKFSRPFLTALLGGAAVFAVTSSRADTAADIYGYASGTAATYDGGDPVNFGQAAYPVVSAILNTPVAVGIDGGYTYSSYAFLANDTSQANGIDIFYSSTVSSYTPTVGDAISVTGTWSPFDGIPEIENSATVQPLSVSLQSQGNAQNFSGGTFVTLAGGYGSGYALTTTIPTINVLANGSLNAAGEGELLTLDNVLLNVSGGAFKTHANTTGTITDQGGNSIVMFQWASSYASAASYGGSAVYGGLVDVTGFVDYFAASSEDEFVPLLITVVPEPATMSLCGLGAVLAGLAFCRFRRKAQA
jgi:PEP-CTERM motif